MYTINGVCVQWIHLAKLRVQWRDLVNTVIKLSVQQNMGNLLSSSNIKQLKNYERQRKDSGPLSYVT